MRRVTVTTTKPLIVLAIGAGMLLCGSAFADTVPGCSPGLCTWAMYGDGQYVLGGSFAVDSSGNVILGAPMTATLTDGATMSVNTLTGNTDPVLTFGLGATSGSSGDTFSFDFHMPIAVAGQINAASKVSYSLTAGSSAGAQIQPLNGHVVVAQDVDTTPGGLNPLNKGVDVGDTFFYLTGPDTQNSPVYQASSMITGSLQYDIMNVTVGFALSPNSSVGISGFVSQTPVPLPAAAWLLGSGVLGLVGVARRRRSNA